MKKPAPLDIAVISAIGIAAIVMLVFIYWLLHGTNIIISNERAKTSTIAGLPCEQAGRRPIAITLASDPEARPLSGLGAADMVFEMPVTPNGITRMMAVFQCSDPKEIGSVRSARGDFIPLAQGVDAILAHWGGERDALESLNDHIIDNIDALIYEGSTFYRKNAIPRPHNGFTTPALLRDRAETFNYRLTASASFAYQHASSSPKSTSAGAKVAVNWPQNMNVKFSYDAATNTYLRWRGGEPEIDKLTGTQISAAVVVIMNTDATFVRDQYIHVRTIGQGTATVWQNGQRLQAHWKKPAANSMLIFTDDTGTPIPLAPGTLWVLIDAPLPAVE